MDDDSEKAGDTTQKKKRRNETKHKYVWYLSLLLHSLIFLEMGFVVPFPNLIAPLLVFLDSNHHIGNPLVAPPSTFVVSKVAAPRLYRRQDDVVGDGGSATSLTPSAAGNSRPYDVWDLPNGRVQFGHPFYLDGMTMPSEEIVRSDPSSPSSPIALWDPTFLGRYETTTELHVLV